MKTKLNGLNIILNIGQTDNNENGRLFHINIYERNKLHNYFLVMYWPGMWNGITETKCYK